MKDFLTDFYNKVMNFFQAEKVEGENTKETAKNRLKLVLMQDRSNLEPETMAKLREELIEVISKYIVIDKEALGLNIDGDGNSMALMLNIPVIRPKSQAEIQAALKEAEKAKEEKAEEESVDEEAAENAEEAVEEEVAEEVSDDTEDADVEKEETEEAAEEETVVEFSEGSLDEIETGCGAECGCGCVHGEACICCDDSNDEETNDTEAEPHTETSQPIGEAPKKNKKSK